MAVMTDSTITCSTPKYDVKSKNWVVNRYSRVDENVSKSYTFDTFVDAWRFYHTHKNGDSFIDDIRAKLNKNG